MKHVLLTLLLVLTSAFGFGAMVVPDQYVDQVRAGTYDDQSSPGTSIGSASAGSGGYLELNRDSGALLRYQYNSTTKKYDPHSGTAGTLEVWFHDHETLPHYHYNRIVNGVVVESGYFY